MPIAGGTGRAWSNLAGQVLGLAIDDDCVYFAGQQPARPLRGTKSGGNAALLATGWPTTEEIDTVVDVTVEASRGYWLSGGVEDGQLHDLDK